MTFDPVRINQLILVSTLCFRKGEQVQTHASNGLRVTEVFAMPHADTASSILTKVDVHFMVVGVDTVLANKHKAELIRELETWPNPQELADGPSYIAVGGQLGDQSMALRLFALGDALGLWKVITPARFGATGEQADQMAGSGFVMMTGFKPASTNPPAAAAQSRDTCPSTRMKWS